MKKGIEALTMGKLIFKAAIYSFYGWFIFAVIEIIIRLMERPHPWSFMILFTLFLYCGIGIALGAVLGGAIFLLLKVAERWRQKIETIPLIMSCCIALIMFFFTGLLVHDLFLPLYPNLPRVPLNLAIGIFNLIPLIIVYIMLTRGVNKTRLLTTYLTLSIVIYAFMTMGLYINEMKLSGNFFDLDAVRILTNSGILISSVILYVIIYRIFIFADNRAVTIRKYVSLKAALIVGSLLLTVGGGALYLNTPTVVKKTVTKPNSRLEGKPNILLITMDTTRVDHLSCYGYHKNTTPHLDKLAQEAVVFKNVYAPSPWTLPSHASLFTGMYPDKHGAHCDVEILKSNWPVSLGERYSTLTEILADHGYKTAGVIGGPLCKRLFGVGQGFEYYDDNLVSVKTDLKYFTLFKALSRWISLEDVAARQGVDGRRVASQINKLVFSWLDKSSQTPFFLFINYFDAHAPYLPPDEYSSLFREDEDTEITESERRKKHALSQYDGEIAYLDDQMGKLFERLKELKIYDNTMLIITSDHGEYFGEHDFWGHGHELYQEVIKVPLIIKYPSSSPQKGVYLKKVSLVDIVPTILNFLNLSLPEDLQGINLFKDSSKVMAEIYRRYYKVPRKGKIFARELKVLFLGNYKYIQEYAEASKGQGELYDIENDPRELNNLIGIIPEKAKEMEMKLIEWLPRDESPLSAQKTTKFDKATEENLKSLGYIQ